MLTKIRGRFMTLRHGTVPGLLVALLLVQGAARAQETASKAYEKAYGYVLGEKWKDALGAFDAYVRKYTKSDFTDAAHYWLCYSRDKMGENPEQVFDCYRTFIKEYPKSKWAKDAQANMVKIASVLSHEGKPQYKDILKSLDAHEDEDVKLAALYALANMGSEKALSTLVSLYVQTESENLRGKIVYALGNFDAPEGRKKLEEIAMADKSEKVRKDAVYALGNNGVSGSMEALKRIVRSNSEREVRKAALYSLGNQAEGNADVTGFLGEIGRTDADEELAKAATNAIGNTNTTQSLPELQRILKEAKSIEVRKAALYAIGNSNGSGSVEALKGAAMSAGDPELRKAAAYAIGNTGR